MITNKSSDSIGKTMEEIIKDARNPVSCIENWIYAISCEGDTK